MSVELTLYVGEVAFRGWAGDAFMVRELARLEIVAAGYDSAIHQLKPLGGDPEVFVWADDGHTEIHEDKYGVRLRAVSLERVLAALKELSDSSGCSWPLDCVRGIHEWYTGKRADIRAVLFFH